MQKQLYWFIVVIVALVLGISQAPILTNAMSLDQNHMASITNIGGYEISGRIRSGSTNMPGITVRLYTEANPNTPIQTEITGNDGIYEFDGLSNNNYIVRPDDLDYDFDPTQYYVTIFWGDARNRNFEATLREYDVDGRVRDDGNPRANITVRLYLLSDLTTSIQDDITDSQGRYEFTDVAPNSYRVIPESTTYTFVPTYRDFMVSTGSVTLQDFEAKINTYDASGQVTHNSSGLANVSVTIARTSNPNEILDTTTTDGNGNYVFEDVVPGNYRITPTLEDYLMIPSYKDIVISNTNVIHVDFEATINIFDISGRITNDEIPVINVSVILSLQSAPETPIQTVSSDTNGEYRFEGVAPGNYRVTPSLSGYRFNPAFLPVTITNTNVSQVDFEADLIQYSVSGRVVDNKTGLEGITITLLSEDDPTFIETRQTDADGNFTFENALSRGQYRLTPSSSSYDFEPSFIPITVTGDNPPDVLFEANVAGIHYLYLPLVTRNYAITPPTPTPTATPTTCREEREPNSLADAPNNGNFQSGCYILGSIPQGDANDFYQIEFPGGTFNSRLTNIPAGTNYALAIYQLNAGQPEIKGSSNYPGNADEEIKNVTLPAGTYYLAVQRVTGNSPEQYRLIWTHTP